MQEHTGSGAAAVKQDASSDRALRMQMQNHTALLAAAFAALEERQAAASGGSWSLAIPAERNASLHAPEHTPVTHANATAAECNASLHAERKHQLFAPSKPCGTRRQSWWRLKRPSWQLMSKPRAASSPTRLL